jgi:hypothetical protein
MLQARLLLLLLPVLRLFSLLLLELAPLLRVLLRSHLRSLLRTITDLTFLSLMLSDTVLAMCDVWIMVLWTFRCFGCLIKWFLPIDVIPPINDISSLP